MRQLQPVIWSKGTFLTPQHLQTRDRFLESVLQFGPGFPSHGSSDMPTWGPIFRYYDKRDERVVKQRIRTLSEYIASLQSD